nr:ABC transporter ATP-binding protein [Anaerosporobacter faecicola]
MAMIKIKNLHKQYNDIVAIKNISFEVQEGDILGLLGPNGAGKSTTISILGGIIQNYRGEVEAFGKNLSKNKKEIKRKIGVVPQDIIIFHDLTARENLEYFGSLYGLKGKELKKHVDETLAFIGLEKVAKRLPKTFSGGMKRRLNIGCAIVHEPKLIILDEPTVGIDAQSRNHILESIRLLHKRGATIIYTSHYMEEIESICDRILIIDKGEIIEQGTTEELLDQYNQNVCYRFTLNKVGNKALVSDLKKKELVESCFCQEENIEIVCKDAGCALQEIIETIEKNGFRYHTINSKKNNLEDIFLQLTGRTLRD